MNQINRILIIAIILLTGSLIGVSRSHAQGQGPELMFVKDYIMTESKNSGIFSLKHPETKEVQWFELYGILQDIEKEDGNAIVTVDVDLFGYTDRNYLLYFIVKKIDGRWTLMEIQVGPPLCPKRYRDRIDPLKIESRRKTHSHSHR